MSCVYLRRHRGNNLAVLAVWRHIRAAECMVVTTAVEHSSVAAACDRLEKQGYEITRVCCRPPMAA